jgi:hypothetical protein
VLTQAVAVLAIPAALFALWWGFVRQSRVVIPMALLDTVETEAFRAWLNGKARWLLWGRDEDGRYYAITFGRLAACRIRNKAVELHRWPGAE